MTKELVKLMKSLYETTGIDMAAFSADGSLLYHTSGFPQRDFSFDGGKKEIFQPEETEITVLPLKNDFRIILSGAGEEYINYAKLIKTLIEGGLAEPKKELGESEKLRLYLAGELDVETAKEVKAKYGGPFDCYVLTLVTDSARKADELKNFLSAMNGQGDLVIPCNNNTIAFIKRCGEEDEYQSATDFAFTLYDNIKEELRINVTVNIGGTVHDFSQLGDFFERCALAYSFGQMLTPGENIYSYKEYIMIKMLSDIPLDSLRRYLDTLLDRDSSEILDDPELMSTAEEFLKNSLNISETSRSMYIHRNTLIYRLDKIEKATGLNLRHFNDAVAFRLLTILNKLVKNNNNGERNGL